MIPPERRDLLTLASDAGFPPVPIGRITVAGEAGWTRALFGCPPAIPRERVCLLVGLERPLLVSTPGGRARLRRWIDSRRAAPTPPMSAAQRREYIAEHVPAYGDETMVCAVVSALCKVPEYVCDAAMNETMFLLVGGRLRGWYGRGTLPTDRSPIQIAGRDDTEQTALHEIAHAWHGPLPHERHPMIPAVAASRAMRVARAEHWPALEHVDRRHAREERLAVALEQIWGER